MGRRPLKSFSHLLGNLLGIPHFWMSERADLLRLSFRDYIRMSFMVSSHFELVLVRMWESGLRRAFPIVLFQLSFYRRRFEVPGTLGTLSYAFVWHNKVCLVAFPCQRYAFCGFRHGPFVAGLTFGWLWFNFSSITLSQRAHQRWWIPARSWHAKRTSLFDGSETTVIVKWQVNKITCKKIKQQLKTTTKKGRREY